MIKTKTGCDVEMMYSDADQHGLIFSKKGIFFEYNFTKNEVDELILKLIKYTQTNNEWKEE